MNAGGSRKGEQQATETNARLADLFEHADPVVAGFMARHNALLERVTVLERILEGGDAHAIARGIEALVERDRRFHERHAPGARFLVPISKLKEYQEIVETVLGALDA